MMKDWVGRSNVSERANRNYVTTKFRDQGSNWSCPGLESGVTTTRPRPTRITKFQTEFEFVTKTSCPYSSRRRMIRSGRVRGRCSQRANTWMTSLAVRHCAPVEWRPVDRWRHCCYAWLQQQDMFAVPRWSCRRPTKSYLSAVDTVRRINHLNYQDWWSGCTNGEY